MAVPVLPDLSRRARRVADDDRAAVRLLRRHAAGACRCRWARCPIASAARCRWSAGCVALAASTVLFAFADALPWLFAARLVQGAADAVTWVVGFALIADLYGPEERGRVMGIVMSGTSVAFMVGPSIGGWLYEIGGIRAAVSRRRRARAGLRARRSSGSTAARARRAREPVADRASCCACARSRVCARGGRRHRGDDRDARAGAAAVSRATLGLGPGAHRARLRRAARSRRRCCTRSTAALADRVGGRRLMLAGLPLVACMLPLIA